MVDLALVALGALIAALMLTPLVQVLARATGSLDRPDGQRKTHANPTPLLGGLAIYCAFLVGVGIAHHLTLLPRQGLPMVQVYGLSVAGVLLSIGGAIDDRWNLPASRQILWPLAASAAVMASGIRVTEVPLPWVGIVTLDLLAVPVTVAWLLGMTYTTKLLDGVDGLVAGVAAIGALVIATLCLVHTKRADTAALSLALAGAFAGFLRYNFTPASIFLGEGGSTLAGFMLGALTIVAGGKFAAALLVIGLPAIDTAVVIFRRAAIERRSPASADRTHLHLRLRDLGLSVNQVVSIYWGTAAIFGICGVVLYNKERLPMVFLLALVLLVTAVAEAAMSRRA